MQLALARTSIGEIIRMETATDCELVCFDSERTSIMCAAFESAWETVCKCPTVVLDTGNAARLRDILAQAIFRKAQQGEFDPQKLRNAALSEMRVAGFEVSE